MSEPFTGEIRIFAGSFAPLDWAFCDGTLLLIQQYSALYTIIGTYYGGDGGSTFGLPNLTGRLPMGQGNGPGLTPRTLGQTVGVAQVTINSSQFPAHNHTPMAVASPPGGFQKSPNGAMWAQQPGRTNPPQTFANQLPSSAMRTNLVQAVGSNQPHTNLQPYLKINFIIALAGIYPMRD